MKNYGLNILLVLIFLFTLPQIKAQDEMSKKEQRKAKNEQAYNEIKPMLEELNFVFQASKANPQSGRQVDLTTHTAYLKVINDSLDVYLPFYGRTYNAAYGGSGGIECAGKYTDYDMSSNEKRLTHTLKFKCRGEGESYEFSLTVSHSGSATLNLISSQRAGISYYGQIENLQTKE